MSINLAVGTQLPAFATSMGRVLLASMTEAELANYFGSANREKFTPMTVIDEGELRKIIAKARKDSYAVVVGQLEEGVESVSVPIHGKDGKVLAAANVSAHPSQISQEELVTKLLPRLQKCVAEIERDLNLEN
jgi:IclR family pca regulon transcriptional regulator